MRETNCFVQVGAARDGFDPYRASARARGMPAVLVETPGHLALRAAAGRPAFDLEVPVVSPSDPDAVADALGRAGVSKPALMLPGFERYVGSTFEAARRLKVPGGPAVLPPLDKAAQRAALSRSAPRVRQPGHAVLPLGPWPNAVGTAPPYVPLPAVVKATCGGGGLGVFRVDEPGLIGPALGRLGRLSNYDGSLFREALLEEWVPGRELGVQGLVRGGEPELLTVCLKVIEFEPDRDDPRLLGFRERAFLAVPGRDAPADVRQVVADSLAAFGYRDGPFHLDMIRPAGGGPPAFLEMGFRLSGAGVSGLVRRLTGRDWAEEAFAWLLSGGWPCEAPLPPPAAGCVGHCLASRDADLRRAGRLRDAGRPVEPVGFARPPAAASTAGDPGVAADLSRHSGFAGRVVASGANPEQVLRLLRACCPDLAPAAAAARRGGAPCVG